MLPQHGSKCLRFRGEISGFFYLIHLSDLDILDPWETINMLFLMNLEEELYLWRIFGKKPKRSPKPSIQGIIFPFFEATGLGGVKLMKLHKRLEGSDFNKTSPLQVISAILKSDDSRAENGRKHKEIRKLSDQRTAQRSCFRSCFQSPVGHRSWGLI